jgi:hypothetical protein
MKHNMKASYIYRHEKQIFTFKNRKILMMLPGQGIWNIITNQEIRREWYKTLDLLADIIRNILGP